MEQPVSRHRSFRRVIAVLVASIALAVAIPVFDARYQGELLPTGILSAPTHAAQRATGSRVRWGEVAIRGTNYSPTGADWCAEDPSPWNCVWKAWDWTKISHEIDLAASLDLNGFRLIGAPGAVYKGYLSEGTYLDHVVQIADYLRAKNMYYYPSCAAAGQEHIGDIPIEWLARFCADVARVVEPYDNVPGMDVVQEYNTCWGDDSTGTYEECLEWARAIADAIHEAAPTLPITFSDAVGFLDEARIRDYAPIVDYFDIHMYSAHTPGDFSGYYSDPDRKPLVFGEIGSKDPGSRRFFDATSEVVKAYGIDVFQWAIVETQGGYGLYDETENLNRRLYDAYRSFPSSGPFTDDAQAASPHRR